MSHVAPSDSRWTPVEVAATDTAMLQRIGRLRFDVWQAEGVLDASRFPDGIWLDEWDSMARHWIATTPTGELVAAARLTVHDRLDQSVDGHVWLGQGRWLAGRTANLSKLVVAQEVHGQGLGSALNGLRIDAAREAGAAWLIGTASARNAQILQRHGFQSAGFDRCYDERPGVPFAALQFELAGDRPPDIPQGTQG